MTPTAVACAGELDLRILRAARTRGHRPAIERAVGGFSRLGEHGGIWLVGGCAGLIADRGRAGQWRRALRAVCVTYAANTAVKLVVRRRRPVLAGLQPLTSTPTQLAFPSAHASTSFAGALAFSRLGVSRGGLYALALGLAASRLYLGVHHPSDVVGGALLGTGVAALVGPARVASSGLA